MWKDTDFCSKRDDDSAIGDSENNSAEEGSMNSRRKSSISDDFDEMTIDAHNAHLASKLGAKIPDCLLKSSEKIVENCQKYKKSCENCKSKAKREIKVLPNAAAVPKKTITEGTRIPKENTSLLEAKFHYLLSEMKKLRELDQEILRTFIELNESVEEVRWKLTEDEEVLKKKMAEEAEDELAANFTLEFRAPEFDDVAQPARNYENRDVIQKNYENRDVMQSSYENHDVIQRNHENRDVTKVTSNYENVDVTCTSNNYENVVTAQKMNSYENVTASYVNVDIIEKMTQLSPSSPPSRSAISNGHSAMLSSGKTQQHKRYDETSTMTSSLNPAAKQPLNPTTKSFVNPSYATIDIIGQLNHVPDQRRTSKKDAERPNNEHLSREPSDVWVVREEFKSTRMEKSRKKVARNSIASFQPLNNHPSPNHGAEKSRRKSDVARPHFRGRSNLGACSFRLVADENSRIGRLGQWPIAEQENSSGVAEFQKQSFPQNAVGLRRFRVPGSNIQGGITKPSDSSSSLNSSSSRTSSESSSSAVPPQSSLKRSNSSSKWGRLFRRSSKSGSPSVEKKGNGAIITNNNYKSAPLATKRISDPVLTNHNIVPTSYKRTPEVMHRWTHHQDDVTYL